MIHSGACVGSWFFTRKPGFESRDTTSWRWAFPLANTHLPGPILNACRYERRLAKANANRNTYFSILHFRGMTSSEDSPSSSLWDVKGGLSKDNKNTLETCKNPLPTSGWSELTKSCTTSTMNFNMAYFSWIPQNNARLKLSCKIGESKCDPYYHWHITLTTSHGMNYVLNEHLDFSQHDLICNTVCDNIVIQLIWKLQESNWNCDRFSALMNSFDTNYIFNDNKNLGQYGHMQYHISQIMPCYTYPASLMNQNEIPIKLTC